MLMKIFKKAPPAPKFDLQPLDGGKQRVRKPLRRGCPLYKWPWVLHFSNFSRAMDFHTIEEKNIKLTCLLAQSKHMYF